jgi:hypothetical protein
MAFTGQKMDHTNLKFGFLLLVTLFKASKTVILALNLTYRKPPDRPQPTLSENHLYTVNAGGFSLHPMRGEHLRKSTSDRGGNKDECFSMHFQNCQVIS